MKFEQFIRLSAVMTVCFFATAARIRAQAYVQPWGNLNGIRVEGQLMKFDTDLRVVGPNWEHISMTHLERQNPSYKFEGNRQVIDTKIGYFSFHEVITNTHGGTAKIFLKTDVKADTNVAGAFFCITLPGNIYEQGHARLFTRSSATSRDISFNGNDNIAATPTDSMRFITAGQQLVVRFDRPSDIMIKRNNRHDILVYIPLISGKAITGESDLKEIVFRATGNIDRQPVTLHIDTSKPGREFAGIGGNFRLQNPKLDPEVIQYNLSHLRVAWGRVELPWMFWQPRENMNPGKAVDDGMLNPRVQKAMEMAVRLHARGIPIILSAWFPPQWAVKGKLHMRPVNGIWGNALDSTKTREIYKSITDYIAYLKDHYGVDIALFSFNESDLGINVRQTGAEHDRLIKGLGAYFKAHGLKTKLLLGDTSDANGFDFIKPAMNDPAAWPYIGAVSFHAWRGWADTTLQKWADAANYLHKPLIVAEGGIDAAAWHYPDIFKQPDFALHEIGIYLKIMRIDRPLAILQWQLTSDYSLLAGGGVFGDNHEPLHPTQRFWNMKQLAATPADLHYLPVSNNSTEIRCVALGGESTGRYVIHLVNDGAGREVTLTGLPSDLKLFRIYVTDAQRDMKEGPSIRVINGKARFRLDETSFTMLVSN